MLDKLSVQVRVCRERALDAKRSAEGTADPALKADFLKLEKRWLRLARSYLFTDKLADFTEENLDWRQGFDERSRVNEGPHQAMHLQQNGTLRQLNALARQATDLSEREGVETALYTQHFRVLASIVECSDDAILSKDLDSVITSWNKGAEQLFGYLAEEIVGKPVTILIPPPAQRRKAGRCFADHFAPKRCGREGGRCFKDCPRHY